MSRQRQPWPTKWIALVILLIIGPYTFLRWHYRKPGATFQPYHDIKERANTQRLLSAGFQRIALDASVPADPSRKSASAAISPAAGGLPATLTGTLVNQPLLPTQILSVNAPPETNTMFSYVVEFTCALPDNKLQLSNAHLYLRDAQIYIVPEFEQLTGALLARNRENLIRLTLSSGALKPGNYEVMLIGAQSSKAWSLLVK